MRYNIIQWRARLRAWAASERRTAIGREAFAIEQRIANFSRLRDPKDRAYLQRQEQAKLDQLHGPLMVALAAKRDAHQRYRLIMGRDA